MESYDSETGEQDIEIPIHRVKKKRQLTEKQKANWQKCLEIRKKNIQLRKKAKMEINQLEKEQLMSDPDLLKREKRLKEILLTLLSSDSLRSQPSVEKPKREEVKPDEVVIKRVNDSGRNEQTKEKHDESSDDEMSDTKPARYLKPKPKTAMLRKYEQFDEDDESNINIFKD